MAHLPVFEPVGEFSSDITGTIVAEQAWFMQLMSLITARCGQRQLKRIGYVFPSARMVVHSFHAMI